MIAHPGGEGCDLSDERNWRTRTSVHVEMGGHHIQVDAGPEFRLQCIRNDIRWIDDFILTHAHADHIMGMDDLRRFCDLLGGRALPVFSHEAGQERIRQVFPYAVGERPASSGYAAFRLKAMPPVLETRGGSIQSTILPHGKGGETLGLVFIERATGKKIAYYTDCKAVPEEARELAAGADVLVLDGLRPRPHPSHMSIDEAVAEAQRSDAKQIFLIHMTFAVDHARTEASLPKPIRLSYDGLRVAV
jgi:phosphoribosyl 1,2-cyclic phosphate phosphodiesterase